MYQETQVVGRNYGHNGTGVAGVARDVGTTALGSIHERIDNAAMETAKIAAALASFADRTMGIEPEPGLAEQGGTAPTPDAAVARLHSTIDALVHHLTHIDRTVERLQRLG